MKKEPAFQCVEAVGGLNVCVHLCGIRHRQDCCGGEFSQALEELEQCLAVFEVAGAEVDYLLELRIKSIWRGLPCGC